MTAIPVRAFRWWIEELGAMVPGRSDSDAGRQADGVIVTVNAQGELQSVDVQRRGGLQTVSPPVAPDGAAAAAGHEAGGVDVADALLRLCQSRPGMPVRIRVPAEAVFQRRIEIPAAARRSAPSILALDLERSTPFKARDVYIAHTLNPSVDKKGWWHVTEFLLKRRFADKAIASVEALGLNVQSIECRLESGRGGAASVIDFPRTHGVPARKTAMRYVQKGLVAAMLALAVGAASTAIGRREAALEVLNQHVMAERGKADVIRRQEDDAAALRRTLHAVRALKLARPTQVEILNEMTRLLPDDVTLTDIKIDGDTLDVLGLAKSAATVTAILESSAMFTGVLQTAPVTYDAASEMERIGLRLRLRQAAKSAAVVPGSATPEGFAQ